MINSYQIVPEAGKISLLVAPSITRPLLLEATAQLALKDSVTILDGGNSFDGYGLARLLRSKTPDLQAALHNVLLSRIFSCYQMKTMLEAYDDTSRPLIVLDMLSTFLDENVRLETRKYLFSVCHTHLQRISRAAPVLVWVRKRSSPLADDSIFVEKLMQDAEKLWQLESPSSPAVQPALFGDA
jgi:hypothetical protein